MCCPTCASPEKICHVADDAFEKRDRDEKKVEPGVVLKLAARGARGMVALFWILISVNIFALCLFCFFLVYQQSSDNCDTDPFHISIGTKRSGSQHLPPGNIVGIQQ